MKLSSQQIKSALFGAMEVAETNGGIVPYKFSAPYREKWFALREDFGKRAEVPTGVRLDFETDAKTVTFSLLGGSFDLLVDGLLTEATPVYAAPTDHPVSLPEGIHRVTLIFPSHDGKPLGLFGVELQGETFVKPHEYGEKFLFLGDSITQGWNSGENSLSYAWRTALFFNADCRILGVGGACFDADLLEIPQNFDPDRVFVAFGTNDFGHFRTLSELQANASAYLDKVAAAYQGKKIYGITPIWRYDTWEKPMGTFDQCIDVIKTEYETRGITVLSGMDFVPHHKDFFSDAVHPNALGFSLYAERLIHALLGEKE